MIKNTKALLLTIFTLIVLFTSVVASPVYSISVSAQTPAPVGDCSFDSVDPDCNPPRLRDFESYLAGLLAVIWAAGGVIFLVIMIGIGFRYLTGAGHPDKETENKGRAGKWVLGIILLYFSRIFVATIMGSLIGDSAGCYEDLNQPVIKIFFADVCTEGDLLPGAGEDCNPADTNPCRNTYQCIWEGALGKHVCQ